MNLNGVSSYGNKAQIQVRCEWNYEFSMESAVIMDMNKNTEYHLEYSVNPADAVFEFSGDALKYLETYTENSATKIKKVETASGYGYFVLTPKSEITGKTLTIKAINPTSATRGQSVGDQTVSVNCYYNTLDVITKVESNGKFSRIENSQNTGNNILYMGDGETSSLIFSFAQPKTTATIDKLEFKWQNQADKNYGENRPDTNMTTAITSDSNGNYTATLQYICTDRITEGYYVTSAYRPTYNGSKILNWKTTLRWWLDRYENHSTDHRSSLGLFSDDYSTLAKYHPKGPSTSEMQSLCNTNKILYLWAGGQNGKEHSCWYNDGSRTDIPVKSIYFGKVKDSSLNGFYSNQEFWSIAYWWCPGDQRSSTTDRNDNDYFYEVKYDKSIWDAVGHSSYHMEIDPHVMTENVECHEGYSNKTSPQNAGTVGTLTVTYSHLGETQTFQIPVMLEIRECEKNLTTTK